MSTHLDAVSDELSSLGTAVGQRLLEVTHEICELLTADIPELRGDERMKKLLDASIQENVATLLHIFGHGTIRDDLDAPLAAIEYARRLAQRDVPIISLVRSYRIGHGRLLSLCLEELAKRSTDTRMVVDVGSRLLDISFRYIDLVSERVSSTYQREHERWLLTQTAVRASRVRTLLGNQPVDIDATETALGYRLRQYHLGLIAWVSGGVQGSEGLNRLEHLAADAVRALAGTGRPLFVPRDESLAWIWIPVAGSPERRGEPLSQTLANDDASLRMAIGEPAYGLEGFRQTHRQAAAVQDLALAARPGTQVTTFAEVGAIALLCSDLNAARNWVWTTLGSLALDDAAHARLRDTLRTFLATGSYRATAEQMMLHKNSVQYRIRRAEEALGADIEARSSDVELALRACHYLGESVLRAPEA